MILKRSHVMKIFYSSKFERVFKKLPLEIKQEAIKREELFRDNIYHPKLKTHKLHWKLNWLYSFSIDYSHRILFRYTSGWDIIFINVGNHDIYKK